jgi:hypothetical protein
MIQGEISNAHPQLGHYPLGHLSPLPPLVDRHRPGSRSAMNDFVEKTVDFMRKGVHLLLIDLFAPTARDPFGIHKVIWDEFIDEPFQFPHGKDRTLVSYEMGTTRAAYIEPIAVGDMLPAMPLFLTNSAHIKVPLESTYMNTWAASPEEMRIAVESGVMPEPDVED